MTGQEKRPVKGPSGKEVPFPGRDIELRAVRQARKKNES